MRKVFAAELEQLMRKNKKICLLDADLAKASGTIKLREIFPNRAFDVGIAEQNMASVAAGLSGLFRSSPRLRLSRRGAFATR